MNESSYANIVYENTTKFRTEMTKAGFTVAVSIALYFINRLWKS